MVHHVRRALVASALYVPSLFCARQVDGQSQINTTVGWDHARQIGMFGALPGNTVFGQSFTAPTADRVLDSFSFWLNAGGGRRPNISFSAFVMAWSAPGAVATGVVLWSSAVRSGPTSYMQRYDFDVGSLSLAPHATYIAFLSTIPHLGEFPSDAQVLMGYVGNPYAGGRFYALSNVDNLSRLTSAAWEVDLGGDFDAAFIANFSAPMAEVPEPGSLFLLASGLLGVGLVARRRLASRADAG